MFLWLSLGLSVSYNLLESLYFYLILHYQYIPHLIKKKILLKIGMLYLYTYISQEHAKMVITGIRQDLGILMCLNKVLIYSGRP